MKAFLTGLLSILIVIACIVQPFAQSNTDKPIIFILDASGSMWGRINDAPKITVARTVLKELVRGLPAEQALGLVAYGHRTKGDCNDVEFILDPSAQNKTQFLTALDKINPLGKTPLAISAGLVIDRLRASKQAAKVILISDGIETCSGDLCTLVADARAEGIDFVLHIVGFDLADSETKALQCAAEAGGGTYYDADDGQQLAEGLQQASTPVASGPVTYTLRCTRDGKLLDVIVRAYKHESQMEIASGRTYDREDLNPVQLALPTGIYNITAAPAGEAQVFMQKIENVEIVNGTLRHDTLDWSMGTLSFLCLQDGERVDVAVKVYEAGTDKFVDSKRSYQSENHNPAVINLPPGTYDVEGDFIKASGVGSLFRRGVVVKPNQVHLDTFDFTTGEMSVFVTENGSPMDATVNMTNKATNKYAAGGRTYTSSDHNPMIKELAPGLYDVEIKSVKIRGLTNKYTIKDVAVKARARTEVSHDFQSGFLRVKTTFNGAICNASINIVSVDPVVAIDGSRTYDSPESNPKEFRLSPGLYKVTVSPVRVEGAQRKIITVEIRQGETLEKTVALD